MPQENENTNSENIDPSALSDQSQQPNPPLGQSAPSQPENTQSVPGVPGPSPQRPQNQSQPATSQEPRQPSVPGVPSQPQPVAPPNLTQENPASSQSNPASQSQMTRQAPNQSSVAQNTPSPQAQAATPTTPPPIQQPPAGQQPPHVNAAGEQPAQFGGAPANSQNSQGSKSFIKKLPLMPIVIGLISLAVIAVVIFVGFKFLGKDTVKLTDYTNEEIGFSIKAPEDWEEKALSSRVTITEKEFTAVRIGELAVMSKITINRTFVGSRDREEVKQLINGALEEGIKERLGEETEITDQKDTEINGVSATTLTVKGVDTIGGEDVPMIGKAAFYYPEDGDYIYSVAVESPEERKGVIKVMDTIINSFKLTK